MNNIFLNPEGLIMNEKYDIKGSWVARNAETPSNGQSVNCTHCEQKFIYHKKTPRRTKGGSSKKVNKRSVRLLLCLLKLFVIIFSLLSRGPHDLSFASGSEDPESGFTSNPLKRSASRDDVSSVSSGSNNSTTPTFETDCDEQQQQ